jgi:DNA-binding transcriptional MerR regulator
MLEEAPAETPEIPEKLYFRIGEVSRLLGVEAYVLRYWETEFPSLSPKKSDTGQRLYKRKDVEQLLQIKELLYAKRFTIEGARQTLADRHKTPKAAVATEQPALFNDSPLPEIRRELAAILDLLR